MHRKHFEPTASGLNITQNNDPNNYHCVDCEPKKEQDPEFFINYFATLGNCDFLNMNHRNIRLVVGEFCRPNFKATLMYYTVNKILNTRLPNYSIYDCVSLEGHSEESNAEHIFPQCKFRKTTPELKTDLHHIYHCYDESNKLRANYRFHQLSGHPSKLGVSKEYEMFNPPHESKGKVARALAYIYCAYPEVDISEILDFETLVVWNMINPVSREEIERNETIQAIQNNRNPFIDFPNLINYLFGREEIIIESEGEYITYTPNF